MRFLLVPLLCVGCASTRPLVPTPSQQVTLVSAVSNLGLFEDEEVRARDVLTKWLGPNGADSRSVAMKGLLFAKEGKHAVTGVSCGQPLGLFDAARRWKTELGIAGLVSANVQCPINAPCELDVWELRLENTDEPLKHWQAEIDEKVPALVAFENAVPQLAAPTERGVGGLGVMGGSSREAVTSDSVTVRVFRADLRARELGKEQAAPFPVLTTEEVLTCMGPETNSDGALFEVTDAGVVSRCEVDNAHPCLCELLSKTGLDPALHASRWNARFHVTRKDRFTTGGGLKLVAYWNRHAMPRGGALSEMVSDASIRGWSMPSERLLAACFENRTQPGRVSSRWEVFFDDLGKVAKVEAKKTAWPALDVDSAACVAKLLRTSVAPCPSRAGLSATVDAHALLGDVKD